MNYIGGISNTYKAFEVYFQWEGCDNPGKDLHVLVCEEQSLLLLTVAQL